MSKVAFVCPIYDSANHFEYGRNLFRSKIDNSIDADLYFIFSSNEQKDKFLSMLANEGIEEGFLYFVIPESETRYKSQVTIKKFYGLRKLYHSYSYLATIDSESMFIKNEDYAVLFDYMWNTDGFLKANRSPNGYFIMRQCFKTLGILDNKKLKKETDNYLYNVWFNDIPLYKCDLLEGFFTWVDSLSDAYKDEWMCFEYYIFMAYLIIFKNFHINKFDIYSLGGIMEYLYVFPMGEQKRIAKMLNTHWTSCNDCMNENISIRFHLDRGPEDEKYNSKTFYDDIGRARWGRIKNIIKRTVGLEK